VSAGVRALFAVAAYLVTAAVLSVLGPYSRVAARAGRLGLPEERPGLSPAALSIFLGRIGDDGRALYMRAVALDFALPALMALAAWSMARWARGVISPQSAVASIVVRVAILAVAAEVIENALLLIAAARHPQRPLLGTLIGPIVSAKFALIALTGIAMVALAGLTILRIRQNPAPR
jgi:hypothetical protein